MLLFAWLPLSLLGLVVAEDRLSSRRLSSNSRIARRGLAQEDFYNITFLHVNDVHSHLDQYRTSGTDCDPPSSACVGGYARLKTKMDEIRAKSDRSLVLNMGDEFQGTLFFSYYGGEKIAETVNSIGFDAMTIGNHEFDRGNAHLTEYLRNMTAPVISANIQTNDTQLAAQIKPYHVFPEHSMAVIGLTTIHTKTTSSPDAGTDFLDPVEVIQRTVDEINRNEKVDRIVAMTHIGYQEDMDLARRTRGIHLILGGHSHTLLGDFDQAEGPYPTIETNLDGEEVFIVTAWRWGQVLGYINVAFSSDSSGRVLEYSGGPIYMDKHTKQDPKLQNKVDKWRKPFDDYAKEVVGRVTDTLDATRCQKGECTLGNFICDAILDYRISTGGNVDGAIMNAGGIRASIPEGNVTRGQIITAFPFGNAIVDLTFTGQELWTMFEGVVDWRNSAGKEATSFIQISSSMSFTYAPHLPIGSRLRSLAIYGKPVVAEQIYTISTIDFVAGGGDGFLYPPKKASPPMNTLDVVLSDYVELVSPFAPFIDGRIQKERAMSVDGKQIVVDEERCYGSKCNTLDVLS